MLLVANSRSVKIEILLKEHYFEFHYVICIVILYVPFYFGSCSCLKLLVIESKYWHNKKKVELYIMMR
uniref:Ovule protein n=1 Tax=Strongyloides venezuelensis TaxID=75913 RepID=A0A0K0FAY4_STRVS